MNALGRCNLSTASLSRELLRTLHILCVARSFASCPQKDDDGQRTEEEANTFKEALNVMTNLYASLCGTAVIQLKAIPRRPRSYDGLIRVFDLAASAVDEHQDVLKDVMRWGGEVVDGSLEVVVVGGAAEARVRFASHEQAERCVAAVRKQGRRASCVFNETAYSRDHGAPYSGWCTAEQGVASMAVAHIAKAEDEAVQRSAPLPQRIRAAQGTRPKLTDLSSGDAEVVVVDADPLKLLEQTVGDLEGAAFVGKGDCDTVKQLLAVFEWDMRTALARVTADYAVTGQTVDAAMRKRAVSMRRRTLVASEATVSKRERPTSALVALEEVQMSATNS